MRPPAWLSVFWCRDPSPSSFLSPDHMAWLEARQTVSRTIHARPAVAGNNSRSVIWLLYKREVEDRRSDTGTEMEGWVVPTSRVLPPVKHSLCKYRADKASVTRKCGQRTHSATRLLHETCKSQLRQCASNTMAASRADGRGWR